jgi:hypothetical protein
MEINNQMLPILSTEVHTTTEEENKRDIETNIKLSEESYTINWISAENLNKILDNIDKSSLWQGYSNYEMYFGKDPKMLDRLIDINDEEIQLIFREKEPGENINYKRNENDKKLIIPENINEVEDNHHLDNIDNNVDQGQEI